MGLSGAIGDAEILANIVGAWLSGSCALSAADPGWARRDERGSVLVVLLLPGRAGLVPVVLLLRDERCSVLVVLLLSLPVVTTVAWRSNCGCLDDQFVIVYERRTLRLITGSMVLAHANSSEVRDCSRSSSGTSRPADRELT
jgi:hypothetical protein